MAKAKFEYWLTKEGLLQIGAWARDKISKISNYAWSGGNDETISEAMNDVMTNGARATNLSKIIYKQVKNDIKKYGIK